MMIIAHNDNNNNNDNTMNNTTNNNNHGNDTNYSNTVSFHNFKSQDFKLSVSNPKQQTCCLFVRTVSNFKLPGSRPQKQI